MPRCAIANDEQKEQGPVQSLHLALPKRQEPRYGFAEKRNEQQIRQSQYGSAESAYFIR